MELGQDGVGKPDPGKSCQKLGEEVDGFDFEELIKEPGDEKFLMMFGAQAFNHPFFCMFGNAKVIAINT